VGDGSIVQLYNGRSTLKLPVTLSVAPGATTVTVDYTLTPVSATWSKKSTEGGDFGGKLSGTLTFTGTQNLKMIANPIWADPDSDTDATYTVTLSNVTGSGTSFSRDEGTATIIALP
jgi:hypothetical protein